MYPSSKNLKVLFISSWYPNKFSFALGNFVQRHAIAVASTGAQVSVLHVHSDPGMKQSIYCKEMNSHQGITEMIIYYKKTSFFPLRILRYFKAHLYGYDQIVRTTGKVDIIHHNIIYPAGLFMLYLNLVKGIPYIVSEHSSVYLEENKKRKIGFVWKVLTKYFTSRAIAVAPVSNHLQKAMVNLGFRGNYTVIPNVVDTALFFNDDRKEKPATKQIIHISTAIDEIKNISGILNVLRRLTEVRNDFNLTIISDGDINPHKAYSDKLGIDKYVFFKRNLSYKEVSEALRNADFLVMFSNYESLPCPIVESLACGKPVVSSDVGGIPEHVNNKMGILVKAGDENGLFDAMNEMLNTCRQYDASMLHQYAAEHFGYETVGRKFVELYEKYRMVK